MYIIDFVYRVVVMEIEWKVSLLSVICFFQVSWCIPFKITNFNITNEFCFTVDSNGKKIFEVEVILVSGIKNFQLYW